MKRFLVLFTVVLVVLLSTVIMAGTFKVGFVVGNAEAFSQVRTMHAFVKIAKEKGWTVYTGDAKGYASKMADIMDTFMGRGVNAIVVAMAELPALKGAIRTAEKAGVPIYAIDSGWAPGIVCNVTSNNFVIGAEMGAYLADRLGYKGNIVAVSFKEHHGTRKRREALDAILEEYPHIKLLADRNVTYANFYEDAQKAMEDYIIRFGSKINAVWCAWDDLAKAATEVLKRHGYTRKDIFVVGADGHPHAFAEIRDPNSPFVATVAQEFEWFAAKTIEIIDKIQVQGIPKDKVIGAKRNIYVPVTLVTPTNVPPKGGHPYTLPPELTKE